MTEQELTVALYKLRAAAPDIYSALVNMVKSTLKILGVKIKV